MCPSLKRVQLFAGILCVVGVDFYSPSNVWAGSARDYLNAPIDSWLAFYNVGYAASVTPEDGLDVAARIRTNVVSQSLVLTRTMDYWGRTGGVSIVLPYLYVELSSGSDRTAVQWCFRHWFPLANEHLWRTCPVPRSVRELRASDFFKLSPVRRNTARGISI